MKYYVRSDLEIMRAELKSVCFKNVAKSAEKVQNQAENALFCTPDRSRTCAHGSSIVGISPAINGGADQNITK